MKNNVEKPMKIDIYFEKEVSGTDMKEIKILKKRSSIQVILGANFNKPYNIWHNSKLSFVTQLIDKLYPETSKLYKIVNIHGLAMNNYCYGYGNYE